MASEPIYDVAVFDYRQKLCSAQTVVETRLLPTGGISIAKVLSYTADCFVTATDVFTGEARVNGRVTFKVLFVDGEARVRSMELVTEFNDKVQDDSITGGTPDVVSRILDIDIIKAAENEIKLAAIVEMDLMDNSNTRLRYLLSGDEIYTSEKSVSFNKLVTRVHDNCLTDGEIAIEGEILVSEARAFASKVTAGIDSIITEGIIVADIITQNDGQINSYRMEVPFSHESVANGSMPNFITSGSVTMRRFSATISQGEETTAFFAFDLDISAFIYSEESMPVITDVFSVTNELSVTKTDVDIMLGSASLTVDERVEGSVTLDNEMPIADKIMCGLGNNLRIANTYINEGKIVLEGTVTSSIVYFSAEVGSINSVDIELPFSIMTENNAEGSIVSASGIVTSLTAKLRRGGEIDIKAQISVNVMTAVTENVSVITGLEIGNMVEIPSSAISLHIGKSGETLWQLAKALRTTPELVLLQNPDITLPLSGGERIVVYRQLKKL